MFCPACGKPNNDFAKFCTACGVELHVRAGEPEQPAEDESVSRVEAFVGTKNTDYYASRFARFDQGGPRTGWHWPAFFLTFYWLLYRKMWLYAALYFILPYLLMIPVGAAIAAATGSEGQALALSTVVWVGGFFILPPMFATSLYYRHYNAKAEAVAAGTSNRVRQLTQLAEKGGTSGVALFLIGGFVLVAVIGILAAIAVPAYQTYVTKARIAQAEATGRVAGESIAAYYYENRKLPGSLDETSFSAPLPQGVSAMEVDPDDGTITITLEGTSPAVDGKSLLLTPMTDTGQHIQWSCSSPDIADMHLPVSCQGAGG